jgi:hypothetical protein
MTITVWTAKANILAALKTALVPDTADIVQIGRPVETPLMATPRRVYIGEVANDVPQPVWEPGSQLRTETYTIPLLIDCASYTGNELGGHDLAAGLVQAIVTAIEDQLADDPSWGAVCHTSGLSLAAESTAPLADQPSGSGWRSGAIVELHLQRRGR